MCKGFEVFRLLFDIAILVSAIGSWHQKSAISAIFRLFCFIISTILSIISVISGYIGSINIGPKNAVLEDMSNFFKIMIQGF